MTIDLDALVSNWRHLAACAGNAQCAAVVKANAYGCGIEPVVAALWKAGCKTFFVAVPEEGLRVKTAAPDATCFVLNGLFATAAPTYVKAGLTPILGSVPEVMTWVETAKSAGKPLPCAVHMDSGMTRLGMSLQELQQISGSTDTH